MRLLILKPKVQEIHLHLGFHIALIRSKSKIEIVLARGVRKILPIKIDKGLIQALPVDFF